MRFLLLVALLVGCADASDKADAPGITAIATSPTPVPDYLRTCRASTPEPLPPPLPRSFESIIAWTKKVEIARETTATALEECRAKNRVLIDLMEH